MSRSLAAALVSSPSGFSMAEVAPLSVPLPAGSILPVRSPRSAIRVRRPLPPRSVLPAEPALFGWLAERFTPGETTLWTGPSAAIDRLLELLYAGSALVRGRILLLEGSNRFNPYRIAEQGQALGLEPDPLLERIRLARAFTAYQLVALVDGWSAEARRTRPTLLIGHELPALFHDTDELPEAERAPLLRHVAARLAALVDATGLPLLLTVSGGFATFPGLADAGPRLADLVKLRSRPAGLELTSYRDGHRLFLVPRAPGQRGLEEFLPLDRTQEVATWAVPHRPTGRHSRNG